MVIQMLTYETKHVRHNLNHQRMYLPAQQHNQNEEKLLHQHSHPYQYHIDLDLWSHLILLMPL